MPCNSSPPPGGNQEQEQVDHVGDRDFRLADADRFDEHHIEARCFTRQHGLASVASYPAELSAAGRGADEHVRFVRQVDHPCLVAQYRAPRSPTDGSTANTARR